MLAGIRRASPQPKYEHARHRYKRHRRANAGCANHIGHRILSPQLSQISRVCICLVRGYIDSSLIQYRCRSLSNSVSQPSAQGPSPCPSPSPAAPCLVSSFRPVWRNFFSFSFSSRNPRKKMQDKCNMQHAIPPGSISWSLFSGPPV